MSTSHSVNFSLPTTQGETHFYESANTSFSCVPSEKVSRSSLKIIIPTTYFHTKRSTSSQIKTSSKGHILECDTAGYRSLATPLKVEFNTITQRWMFSSETKLRTRIAPVHEGVYASPSMRIWAPKKQFFVLDDGQTCVVKADIVDGQFCERRVKKDAKLYGEDGFHGMIKLTKGESEEARARIERSKGRFLMSWKEYSEHSAVVRYMGLF
jgi:hypothetical protein